MFEITYQDANPEADYEFARKVHHLSYRDVVISQFGSWNESEQDIYFEKGWKGSPHSIILLNKIPIGVLSAVKYNDHIFLSEIQILPEYQGQGVGSHTIKDRINYAKKSKLPLRLQVLKQNKRAIDLYLRLGFIVTGNTDIHFLMEWR